MKLKGATKLGIFWEREGKENQSMLLLRPFERERERERGEWELGTVGSVL